MLAACVCVVSPLSFPLWLTANGVFLSHFLLYFFVCLDLVLFYLLFISWFSVHMPVRAATMDDYCCCDDVIGWPWRRSPPILSFPLFGMLYCCLLSHWCESGERPRILCSAALWQCTVNFVSLAGFVSPPEGVSHWQIALAISSAGFTYKCCSH
jgi:hypothetical protein